LEESQRFRARCKRINACFSLWMFAALTIGDTGEKR
jgi:hypothetical protein